MRYRLALLVALILSIPLVAAEPTQRYLVEVTSHAAAGRLHIVSNSAAAAVHRVRTFRHVDAFAADLTPSEVKELRASGDVVHVTAVVPRRIDADAPSSAVVNEIDLEKQTTPWGVAFVHAPQVWPVTRGEGVNVAVIDTGIDSGHPDLADNYAGGTNVLDPAGTPMDDHKHGTHVAGIIAAEDNDIGVVGIAPRARLWAVKVLDSRGDGTDETVIAGIDWVIDQAISRGGRWVINMSLGSGGSSELERQAVAKAMALNIIVVASAGNNSFAVVSYPGHYPGVIAVGAIDDTATRAGFSSYGDGLAVVAPGVAVRSTLLRGVNIVANVRTSDEINSAWGVTGSPMASVEGSLVECGLGMPGEFPPDVAGKIALVHRGEIPFREKARNAKEAGATAVVIWDNKPEPTGVNWTMLPLSGDDPSWATYPFPLTIGVSQETGAHLAEVAVPVNVAYREEPYGNLSGTSMAAPHVSGIAALVLAADPEISVAQTRYVIERTATDIDDPGPDRETAWGIADALAAAKYVAPYSFGVPPPVPIPPPRRRSAG